MSAVLFGCDFSSAPSRRKPIVLAFGAVDGAQVTLHGLETFDTLDTWADWLTRTPAWVGGFDFPFGLPRELVAKLGWPLQWSALMAHYAAMTRAEIRAEFAGFCAGRPVGGKFAHRATDAPAGSSPSMKWVNPPVAFMLHAGVPRLLAAGAELPGLHVPANGMASRIALESYPGLLARELIGGRSYKADDRARQTPERMQARADLLDALGVGSRRLGLTLVCGAPDRNTLLADAQGDRIDSVLCLVQAAWATLQPAWGLPAAMDSIEGWIISA